jgi:hypothetical protein
VKAVGGEGDGIGSPFTFFNCYETDFEKLAPCPADSYFDSIK